MRSSPILLLLLSGCALTAEQEKNLESYQSRASLYWEGGHLGQALGQIEMGLAIEPDDYKLLALQAAIHLRESNPYFSTDQRMLDLSLEEFETLWNMRSANSHDRRVLFFYALARQRQGMRLLSEAERLRTRGSFPTNIPDPIAAKEVQSQADQEFAAAQDMLQILLDRGELERLCHYHMMQLAIATNDSARVISEGDKYLKAVAIAQQQTREAIASTVVYGWEVEQKKTLEELRKEELDARAFLAERLNAEGQYEDALRQLNAILRLDPSRSADYYNRGVILRKLGRLEQAKADLRTFVATTSLPSDSPKIVDAIQTLQRE